MEALLQRDAAVRRILPVVPARILKYGVKQPNANIIIRKSVQLNISALPEGMQILAGKQSVQVFAVDANKKLLFQLRNYNKSYALKIKWSGFARPFYVKGQWKNVVYNCLNLSFSESIFDVVFIAFLLIWA